MEKNIIWVKNNDIWKKFIRLSPWFGKCLKMSINLAFFSSCLSFLSQKTCVQRGNHLSHEIAPAFTFNIEKAGTAGWHQKRGKVCSLVFWLHVRHHRSRRS